jgi:membrane protease YdiL (CAAX protease family)
MQHTEKQAVLQHRAAGEQPLLWPALFYVVMLVYCLLVKFMEWNVNPVTEIVNCILFAVIVLAFSLRDIHLLKDVFILRRFHWGAAALIVAGSVLAAAGVDWLAGRLERLSGEYYLIYMFEDSPFPILLSIISTAFFPAFFEELAFRGIIYAQLRKVMGVTATIIVTAVAFSILHMSPLSLIWIFPIGIVTAWLRSRYDTIWYGIILHFTYNSSIVLLYFWTNRYFS